LVEVYRPRGVVFYGIEWNFATNLTRVRAFCSLFSWDFPVGMQNTSVLNIFELYATGRHNYFVIGADGRIAFRAQSNTTYVDTTTFTYKPFIIQAINEALAVPVETTTWGRIKSFYR
jgi:hypothetical protein